MNSRLCFALLLTLCDFSIFAADAPRTFHVDATRGDDALDGLTPETAWKSLGKVNTASLVPGDKVLFRRGETWRGQLTPQSGDATGAVYYGAFGDGPKPRLLGSAALNDAGDWIPAGEHLWATLPLSFQPSGPALDLKPNHWNIHAEGGAACTLSPLLNTDGGYTLRCSQSGSASNHIQLYTVGLSVREGAFYLLRFRARCTKPASFTHFSVMLAGAPYTAYATARGSVEVGADWTDCAVRFQAQRSGEKARLNLSLGGELPAGATLDLQMGSFVEATCSQRIPLSVDVGNIIFDAGKATGFKKWRVSDLKNDGDYFYDAKTWQVTLRCPANPTTLYRSIELALNRHIINEGSRSYATYENLALLYGAAHGVGGGSTHHITVRGCDIGYIGGGHQLTTKDGKPVRFGNGVEFWAAAHDNLVENNRIWEIYDAAVTNQGDGVNVEENITYRNNTIWNSEYSFEFWNRGPESHARNIRFEHNTCVNAGFGWGHAQRPDPNGRHLMFYSNTAQTENVSIRFNIFSGATDSCLRLHGRDWTAALTLDDNLWYNAQGPLILWDKQIVAADQFAAFQNARGFDKRSRLADPKFLAPENCDFRLAPNSPARELRDGERPAGAGE